MKRCPLCHREFADSITYCERDGNLLEPGDSHSSDPNAPDTDSLSSLLALESRLEIDRALRLAISICDAVEEMRRAGRAIRSLQPQNILVAGREKAKEFIRKIKDSEAIDEVAGGLSPYSPPEAAQQQEADAAGDVYSIGAILYEMLTGQVPFTGSTPVAIAVKKLLESPRPPRDLRSDIPDEIQRIILRSLDKEKSARQQSASQLKRELEEALNEITKEPDTTAHTGALLESAPIMSAASQPSPPYARSAPQPYATRQSAAPGPPSPMTYAAPSMTLARSSRNRAPIIYIGLAVAIIVTLAIVATFTLSLRESSPPPVPVNGEPSNTSTGANQNISPAPGNVNGPTQTDVPVTSSPAESALLVAVIVSALVLAVGASIIFIWLIRRKTSARTSSPPSMPSASNQPESQPQSAKRGWSPPAAGGPQTSPSTLDATYGTIMGGVPTLPPQKSSEAETVRTPSPKRAGERITIKRCPSCKTEFSVSIRFCVHDGTPLKEEVKTIPADKDPSFYDLQTLDTKKLCPACNTEYAVTKKFCPVDGERLATIASGDQPAQTAEEMEPFMVAQYRCFARLGEGGMGIVYKARDVDLDRLAAVKVLLPQTANLPDAVRFFRREAQLASSINHPNSVIIYNYGEASAQLFYMAMEFIPGKSLSEIMEPKGQKPRPLPLPQVLNITRQICDVLDTAHTSGIVHRDLKPQNVMVCERPNRPDSIKVVDFGIARSLTHRGEYGTLSGTLTGTPAYMSPEQARMEMDVDARSDIFSLAMMVYQMMSSALPFRRQGLNVWQQIMQRGNLREGPPPLSGSRPDLDIPAEVDRVLRRALDPDRDNRTQSALLFMDELEHAVRAGYRTE